MSWWRKFLCKISGGKLPFCGPPERDRPILMTVKPTRRNFETDASWWPSYDGEPKWCSMDPYDPPGWTIGEDEEMIFSTDQVWADLGLTGDEFMEYLKEEWIEERGDGWIFHFEVFE